MTTEQFTYWLQGYFELSGATTLSEEQVKVIKEHLSLALKKVTQETVYIPYVQEVPNNNPPLYPTITYTTTTTSDSLEDDRLC